MGGQLFEWALTGPVLGTLNDPLLGTLVISTDNGATWDRRDAAGLPADNPTFGWIDFADARHGAATVFSNIIHSSVLLVSANGGRSWLPVDLASARLHAPPDATSDASLAGRTASDFVVFTTKDPPSAWAMLSPFSQHAFGTESAFATAEGTRANRENYQFTASSPTQSASVLNATVLGQALWSDLQSNAVVSRAYAVRIDFPSGAFAWLVIAPMAATGELRVWVVDATG
jgi:hypothetical protein